MGIVDRDLRDVITETLISLNKNNKINLLVVDSKTSSKVSAFEKAYPNSFFNLGIAEQLAINVAAGLSSCGECVVIIGIAAFITMRCYEQIRTMLAYNNYNVKIIGLWTGLYYSDQGHTHTLIEDVALMRVLPNVTIYSPSDHLETKAVIEDVISNPGFAYVRVDCPLSSHDYHNVGFKFKRGRGEILKEGNNITLISMGKSICECMEASFQLAASGIFCRVVNMCTLKPLDHEVIIDSIRKTDAIITVEEHKVIGGLGSAVAEIIALQRDKLIPFRMLGVGECFYKNLNYEEAKNQHGISVDNIVRVAKKLLGVC